VFLRFIGEVSRASGWAAVSSVSRSRVIPRRFSQAVCRAPKRPQAPRYRNKIHWDLDSGNSTTMCAKARTLSGVW